MRRRGLLCGILIVSLAILAIWPRPVRAGLLICRPYRLYRGETLTIDLPNPHADYEFEVWGEDLELLKISFKPGPKDTVVPVIAPGVFASMKRVTLPTTTAQGFPSHFWHGDDIPQAHGSPRLIFAKTGHYEFLLGLAVGAEDQDFDGCWVDYINTPRPKSVSSATGTKPWAAERTFTNELVDVGSTTMSRSQVRALRMSAEREGSLIMQEDDHFHLQLSGIQE